MDNNSNNNISGIPNVSDIKFDDTPAESFDNLYGGVSGQSVGAPTMNQASAMTPNPGMTPGMNQAPAMAPNPGMAPGVNQAPAMAPNPGIAPGVNQASAMAPNPGMAPGVNQASAMAPNLGMAPGVNQASVMGSGSVVDSEPMMKPNPGTIIQPDDISNMDIDVEKMQSIEEQLSKTSQYNPADFQQEQISIPTDNQSEKNKSGLAFVIVLFVILALVIAFLPQITKMIK